MTTSTLTKKAEAGKGKLYESNGFLVPDAAGSGREMGKQYETLMVEYMQQAYDLLVEPNCKNGAISDDVLRATTDRIYSIASIRYRQFYYGVVKDVFLHSYDDTRALSDLMSADSPADTPKGKNHS